MDTTESIYRENLVNSVKNYAQKWLDNNTPTSWHIPEEDFGNQSIDFAVIDIDLQTLMIADTEVLDFKDMESLFQQVLKY